MWLCHTNLNNIIEPISCLGYKRHHLRSKSFHGFAIGISFTLVNIHQGNRTPIEKETEVECLPDLDMTLMVMMTVIY